MNPLSRRKQKLSKKEIDSAIRKISAEYDKYIVTYQKSTSLKNAFERRCSEAIFISTDMERFLGEEIAAVKSLFDYQEKLLKERVEEQEKLRIKEIRKSQPDFADRILKKLKEKMIAYPPLKIHNDASYEIIHLYGAINNFDRLYWPKLDHFISDNQSWGFREDKKDFNNEIWRFVPSGPNRVPPVLEHYCLLLNSKKPKLREISTEAQQCIKRAAFLLNGIVDSCNSIIKTGIDGGLIKKDLEYIQNIILDFRIKDFKQK
ncbi:MAG: hypothetical protein GY760_12270 [Deltaproteobacteria bacterium]|nr:hypothetical protein [Deltaproteobacteria bacterium]